MSAPKHGTMDATPRVAAGALFVDQDGRILLVQPTYKDHWDLPGGYFESSESPLQACRRELNEELGITPHIGRLLVVDWAPLDDEGDKLLFVSTPHRSKTPASYNRQLTRFNAGSSSTQTTSPTKSPIVSRSGYAYRS